MESELNFYYGSRGKEPKTPGENGKITQKSDDHRRVERVIAVSAESGSAGQKDARGPARKFN